MAYSLELLERIRALLADPGDVVEKKMFGGLGFLAGGHIAVAASGRGGIMVRVEPGDTDALLAEPGAAPLEMRGQAARGWLRVAAEALDDDAVLRDWAERGLACHDDHEPLLVMDVVERERTTVADFLAGVEDVVPPLADVGPDVDDDEYAAVVKKRRAKVEARAASCSIASNAKIMPRCLKWCTRSCSASGASAIVNFVASSRLRFKTSSSRKIWRVARAARQASGLPV